MLDNNGERSLFILVFIILSLAITGFFFPKIMNSMSENINYIAKKEGHESLNSALNEKEKNKKNKQTLDKEFSKTSGEFSNQDDNEINLKNHISIKKSEVIYKFSEEIVD